MQKRREPFPIHFMKPMLPKTDQDIKRKQQTNYLLETQMQNSQQNTSKLNPARHEKDNSHNQVKFIPGMQSKSIKKNVLCNSIHVLYNYLHILWCQFSSTHVTKLDTHCWAVNDRLLCALILLPILSNIYGLLSSAQSHSQHLMWTTLFLKVLHLRAFTPATASTQKVLPLSSLFSSLQSSSQTAPRSGFPSWLCISVQSVSQFSRSVVSDSLEPHGLQHCIAIFTIWNSSLKVLLLCRLPHQNVNSMKTGSYLSCSLLYSHTQDSIWPIGGF